MKPICFIGARGGSKGVPRKNIRKIAGKPLIAYTIQSALKSKLFSHVFVSTEDKEIASIAKKSGAEVPFSRPKHLATSQIGFAPVLFHGIKKLFSLGYDFETLVLRDCTAPFIRNIDMENTIKLLEEKKPHAVFGVYRQHFNPYFNMFELNSHGFLKLSKTKGNRPRSRQEAPPIYQMTGLDTFNVEKFLKYKKIILPKILPYEIPPETGIMIDTELEFKTVEMIIQKKLFKEF
ncbi:acylneuraminate cytidylyltransferase family protein [Nitrosopumilus sp.]|uniref:acylneuraminate cytidylyltransferase family protein n=1 Tax=Nitrosopumilus sp. TaxID=2024843 RepID=UPI0024307C7F|nr:acylneuraminate cytidylyltransferase family protein [Nitrosopumilus sp.]MCV0366623.1 acylneuraminate cytidylyltransferase family protein [Nitrosopumilus sp.]MCV0410546.1 acylneuraminate cytidylyltransferase family protein [Nitrosopumilus sp.]